MRAIFNVRHRRGDIKAPAAARSLHTDEKRVLKQLSADDCRGWSGSYELFWVCSLLFLQERADINTGGERTLRRVTSGSD